MSSSSSESVQEGQSYYGVCVPSGTPTPNSGEESFYSRTDALALLKLVKTARMKKFDNKEEAIRFSNGSEVKSQNKNEVDSSSLKKSVTGESLPYSSLKTQDLTQFRLALEKGNLDKIEELVSSNPRYLIASGDTPAILQERYRYNALHTAALKGQTDCAEKILNWISSRDFHKQLYPNSSDDVHNQRIVYLIDLYLNTPEKGNNETPLHCASKFGHASMVQLLANEPLIKINVRNKYDQTAADVACSRNGSDSSKKEIQNILTGQFYVPLMRSQSDDCPPVIGAVFSPGLDQSDDHDVFTCITSPVRSAHQYRLPSSVSESLQSSSPGSYNMVVRACAGPMSPQQAAEFKRSWSTPKGEVSKLKLEARKDLFKGQELVGRNLAKNLNVNWLEFWEFLDCSVDFTSESGLNKLEEYLLNQEKSALSQKRPATPENNRRAAAGDVPDACKSPSDQLNTTDDRLAHMFEGLTLHSPTSPSHPDNIQAHAAHSIEIHQKPKSPTVNASPAVTLVKCHVTRTMLESIVPSLAPAFDTVRRMWPFGWSPIKLVKSSLHPAELDQIPFRPSDIENSQGEIIPNQVDRQVKTPDEICQEGTTPTVVFIQGDRPCKVDIDVMKALNVTKIDSELHPAIKRWITNLEQYPDEERQSWPSPMVKRHRDHMSKIEAAESRQSRYDDIRINLSMD